MTSEMAASAHNLHSWISESQEQLPDLRSDRYPDLPAALNGTSPLRMCASLTLSYLRIASHIAYEMAVLLEFAHSSKASLILARSSVEASANAHHLASNLSKGEEDFLRETLRERIWMARESRKTLDGGQSEYLDPLIVYAQDQGLLRGQPDETNSQFAKRVSNGRNMSDRIEKLFPSASNDGFHYGFLSGFAHVNPSIYLEDLDGTEFTLAFGAVMTALRESVSLAFEALDLQLDLAYFESWFE